MPERHQMGSLELGRQRPQKALQESLQTPALRRPLHPGATALGVLREEEEADGKVVQLEFSFGDLGHRLKT